MVKTINVDGEELYQVTMAIGDGVLSRPVQNIVAWLRKTHGPSPDVYSIATCKVGYSVTFAYEKDAVHFSLVWS